MDAAEPVAAADHQHRPVERRGAASESAVGSRPAGTGWGWAGSIAQIAARCASCASPRPTDHEEPTVEHRARGVAERRREVGDDPNAVRARVDAEHLRSAVHAVGAARDEHVAADGGDRRVAQRMRERGDVTHRMTGAEREHRA